MRRALAALAVALGTITVAPVAAHADDPQRILIVGDSVTQGRAGEYTWRYFLWKTLEGQSVDFVGSSTGVFKDWDWNYNGSDAYADPDFDQGHAAVYGGTIQHDGHWLQAWPIQDEIAQHNPDVVTSMWALNDLGNEEQSVDDVIGFYRAWFARARAAKPTVDFVVSELPQTWLLDGRVTEFNAKLRTLADDLRTDSSQIIVARVDEFTQNDTREGVHPNESGERKIAAAMADALAQVKVDAEPVAPEPVPPTVVPVIPAPVASAPVKPSRVKAVRVGVRVKVSWRSSDTRFVVKCGARSVDTGRKAVTLRAESARRCSVQSVTDAAASPWASARVRQPTRQ